MQPAIPAVLTLPARTLSGRGSARGLLPAARALGARGVVVCGRTLPAQGRLAERLGLPDDGGAIAVLEHAGGEPTLAHLECILAAARAHRPDWVLAVGGGSVMDLGKAVAGLLNAPLPAVAYHDGAPIPPSDVPFLAAPTTAGTGSEATSVCVLTNAVTGLKKSFRHPSFVAGVVALDADLLDSCPARVMASAGMDAFTQAIEAYISRHATDVTDAWALQAVGLLAVRLPVAYRNGTAGTIGQDLLAASYLAGLALSNARLGLVHGLAHPLGARFHIPHGLVCAVCLPHVLRFNLPSIPAKAATLGRVVGGDIVGFTLGLLRQLEIVSPLAGQPLTDEAAIVAETLASGSTAANPRTVTAQDVAALLAQLISA